LGTQAARDGYDDVIGGLFARILDLESDRGDFLQVRFWVVLKRLAIRAFKQQVTHRKRAQEEAPLTSLAGYDRDEDDPSGQSAQPLRDVETASTAATADIERYQLAQEALTRLEEPYRSAFLLRHYAGWPVEDEDPSVRTISRQFGKTPRTIRNWLNRAEDALQKWRGEE
jgi:RNA polymerase sigma factor (sigma-70 family)